MKKLLFIALLLNVLNCFSQDSSKIYFDKAFELMSKGDNHKALAYYEKAILFDSNSWEIWLEYTTCLRKNKRFQRALQAGFRSLELKPDNSLIWTNLGNIYLECRYWNQAYDSFFQYEKLNSDTNKIVQNFLNLGFNQMTNKDFEGADKSFKHAILLQPNNGLSYVDYGLLHLINGDIQNGKDEIEKGIKLMKKAKNKEGIKYANSILSTLKEKGSINYDIQIGSSYQILPDRFLKLPATKSLDLQIDTFVERQIQIKPTIKLSIITPESWNENTKTQDGLVFVHFKTLQNESFLITPYTLLLGMVNQDGLIKFTKTSGDKLLPNSVESNYEIKQFQSNNNTGTYFTLTDKTYKGGEDDFKYITSGFMLSEKMPIAYTILTNSHERDFISKYLNVLEKINIK